MAVVLIVRPWGLFGKARAPARAAGGVAARPLAAADAARRAWRFAGARRSRRAAAAVAGDYALDGRHRDR